MDGTNLPFSRRYVAGALLSLPFLGLTSCGVIGYQKHVLRYRMTVLVQTPEGQRSGSGVLQVSVVETPFWDLGSPTLYELFGESVSIDLPDGRTMFALLGDSDRDYSIHLPFIVFASHLSDGGFTDRDGRPNFEQRVRFLMETQPTAMIERGQWPTFVWFRDINDYTSVVRLDDSLNSPVRILRVSIEITSDSPTRQVMARLPWLRNLGNSTLANTDTLRPSPFAARLERTCFMRTK